MTKEKLNNGSDEEKANTKNILGYVLDQTLKLLHPIMPFVTEKLWQSMPHDGKSIMVAQYPTVNAKLVDDDATEQMDSLIEMIKAVRSIRNEANAPMSKPVDILVKTKDAHLADMLSANRDYIDRFCHPAELQIGAEVKAPQLAMSSILAGAEVFIPMAELVDLDEERAKMEKEIAKLQKEVDRSNKKLGNQKFVENAPEKVVAAEKQKAVEWQEKLATAKDRLASLQNA